jgi:hypothetical protein
MIFVIIATALIACSSGSGGSTVTAATVGSQNGTITVNDPSSPINGFNNLIAIVKK